MNKPIKVNWEELAIELKLVTHDGERGGSRESDKAVEKILGEQFIKNTVDYSLTYRTGFTLSEGVLANLRSQIAIDYCYEIYKSANDSQFRSQVLMLLKKIGNETLLKWLPEFLKDEDCQGCALDILDQLIFCGYVEDFDSLDQNIKDVVQSLSDSDDSLTRAKSEWLSTYPDSIENEFGVRIRNTE
jgi:hypothetical protein